MAVNSKGQTQVLFTVSIMSCIYWGQNNFWWYICATFWWKTIRYLNFDSCLWFSCYWIPFFLLKLLPKIMKHVWSIWNCTVFNVRLLSLFHDFWLKCNKLWSLPEWPCFIEVSIMLLESFHDIDGNKFLSLFLLPIQCGIQCVFCTTICINTLIMHMK